MIVIWLADSEAKPVANHANAHPMHDWSCRICNQHRAHVSLRGTGFKTAIAEVLSDHQMSLPPARIRAY
jgi:hypothetical protein